MCDYNNLSPSHASLNSYIYLPLAHHVNEVADDVCRANHRHYISQIHQERVAACSVGRGKQNINYETCYITIHWERANNCNLYEFMRSLWPCGKYARTRYNLQLPCSPGRDAIYARAQSPRSPPGVSCNLLSVVFYAICGPVYRVHFRRTLSYYDRGQQHSKRGAGYNRSMHSCLAFGSSYTIGLLYYTVLTD